MARDPIIDTPSSGSQRTKNVSAGRVRSISGPANSGPPKGQGERSAPVPSNPYK